MRAIWESVTYRIVRSCPRCKAVLKKENWPQPWKCGCCGWE